MQSLVHAIYPTQCASCGEMVDGDAGLCGACWRETRFVMGHVCDLCGTPLPGQDDGTVDHCDECLTIARPWSQGRTALVYAGNGRRLVLAFKHADRPDIARPAAGWLAKAAAPILKPNMVIVPVPSHWTRMFRRKYNQAAELARALGRQTRLEVAPNALIRTRGGETQEGKTFDQRFANLDGVIRPHPRKSATLVDRHVLIVDDVMTSGATLAAATEALKQAGVREVSIATLARVVRDA